MFGKQALLEVIRRNSDLAAAEIIRAVIAAVKQFQAGVKPEDDITLVAAKLNLRAINKHSFETS